jgi:hypothetical protein
MIRTKRLGIAGIVIALMLMVTVPAGARVANPLISGAATSSEALTEYHFPESVNGGKTKIKKHWWGFAVFLNSQDSNIVIGGGGAAAAFLAHLGLPGKIVAAILAIGAGVLTACRGNDGIYIHAAWIGPSWCKRQ